MLLAVTTVFWAAAAVRAWRWYTFPRAPELRAITTALLAIALALTLDLPSVQRLLARLLPHPAGPGAISDLGKQVAIVVGAWACQSLLLHLTHGAAATRASERRRTGLALTVGIVTTGIYLVALIDPALSDEPGAGIAQPFVTESRLLVLLYAGTVLFFVMMLCWTHPGGGSLGGGVWLMGAGCAVMVAYALTRILYFSAARYAHAQLPEVYHLGDQLQAAGLGLVALGTLVPRVGQLVTSWRQRRAYAALEPLWSAVSSRVPGVVFAAAPEHGRSAWELDRRIIEIQDGLMVLAPGLQLDDAEPDPAQRLADALVATKSPARILVGGTARPDTRSAIAPQAGTDLLRWLQEVSSALPRTHGADLPAS